jgi:hypothetical protein
MPDDKNIPESPLGSLTKEIVTELANLPEGEYAAEILFHSHGDGKTLDVINLVVLGKK